VLRNEQRLGSRVIERAARQLAASFNSDRIAGAVAAALEGATLSALQQRLSAAQHQAVEVLAGAHLPHLPSRADIAAQARAMFARTPSVDDIVERAYLLLLDAISARLRAVPVQA
jgi:stearoyl-CoA desaturase (delta-9 desaturase)